MPPEWSPAGVPGCLQPVPPPPPKCLPQHRYQLLQSFAVTNRWVLPEKHGKSGLNPLHLGLSTDAAACFTSPPSSTARPRPTRTERPPSSDGAAFALCVSSFNHLGSLWGCMGAIGRRSLPSSTRELPDGLSTQVASASYLQLRTNAYTTPHHPLTATLNLRLG